METVRPRRIFLHTAFFALENRGVTEMLKEASVDPAQGFPALGASIHSWFLL